MHKWMLLGAVLLLGLVTAKTPGLADNIQGYTGWTRVNASKVTNAGAHPAAKDVYVNLALDKLVGTDGKYKLPFASGTLFVKERTDPDTLTVTTIYVMEKKSEKVGDWAWSVFERKGDAFEGGLFANAAMCVACHQNGKDSDWVFTKR